MDKKKRIRFEPWHRIAALLLILDVLSVNLSYFLALWLRFDLHYTSIPKAFLSAWKSFTLIYTVFCIVVFWLLKLYHSLWRYASYDELERVAVASVITTIFHIVGITVFFRRMPISYYLMGALFQFVCVLGCRFAYRFLLLMHQRSGGGDREAARNRVMIIGAGAAGQMILRDIRRTETLRDKVVCFIDDDPNKWNRYIDGVPIAGGREDILRSAQKYGVNKIYLAIPSASAEARRDILNICKETGCELKNLPGMYQFVLGDVSVSALKDVAIEDLLGREPIRVEMEEVFGALR